MATCAIQGCPNTVKTVGNVAFHRFPNDPFYIEQWVAATGRKNWKPTAFSRICSVHFSVDCFNEKYRCLRLNTTAVPTIDIHYDIDNTPISTISEDKDQTPLPEPEVSSEKQLEKAAKMSEVDKFKRRVIRAVARLLRKEQTPGEEMWKALQKEAGCDCELLWKRMRALTLKKMKRLILAEDRLENIAAVAKMTLTDWLLFDLVLVHEDIDVIGQDLKSEPTVLTDLFNVVKRFQIEGKQGEALATAWTGATFYYNSFGRQCSPMLLQRRWYQLKKVTRANFYKFWFEYRGNARLLIAAKKVRPTKLQSEIAQRFPHIVTMPFLEWDQMIKDRWIILPEEFESKLKSKNKKPKPETPAANEPDLVLLEPRIETIDLGVDSDPEPEQDGDSQDSPAPFNPVSLAAAIKQEPCDEFEMELENESAAKTIEDIQQDDRDNEVNAAVESIENMPQETVRMPMICNVAGNFDQSSVDRLLERENDKVMAEVNDILISAVEGTKTNEDSVETNEKDTADINQDEPMQIVSAATDNAVIDTHNTTDEEPVIESTAESAPIEIDESDDAIADASGENEVMTEVDKILKAAAEVKVKTVEDNKLKRVKIGPKSRVYRPDVDETSILEVDESDKDNAVMTEIDSILVSAIQGKKAVGSMDADDNVVEIISESSDEEKQTGSTKGNDKDEMTVSGVKIEETPLEELINNIKSGIEASADDVIDPAIDISTDMTFDDDGIEFVDDGIAFEDESDCAQENIAKIKTEIGDSTAENTENIDETPKFDLKLLMHPCVITVKLEDMTVFKNKDINEVRDKLAIETAIVESKVTIKQEKTEIEDDQDKQSTKSESKSGNSSSDSEDEGGVPESKRVKLSSYMLQKPKSRSYNPIQLCKNPDFNTRLKRLTVGFLSSNRNRLLLKCLKPMTIDLSKAFESKLIDGTVYLKSDDGVKIKREKSEEPIEETSVSAVVPSAMPVQSLIDNSNLNLQDLLPSPPRPHIPLDLPERQKTINLPDINNIRRINQQLLTAEVTPMRMQATDKFAPPVQLVSLPNTNDPKTSQTDPITNPGERNRTHADPPSAPPPAERKKPSKQTYRLTWNSIRPTKTTGKDEFLLTLDALNKMLLIFKEEDPATKSKNERAQRNNLVKQRIELQKRMDQFERRADDEPAAPEPEDEAKKAKDAKEAKETKEVKTEKKKDDAKPEKIQLKVNVVTDKPYGPYCCWARNKIESASKKALRAHQCPRICRCCCRGELADKYHRPNPRLMLRKNTPTIVISDEEDGGKISDSVERVVNKSQGSTYVRSKRPPPMVDVSTQSNTTSSAFGKLTVTPALNATPASRPAAPDAQPIRPVRVRKDLMVNQTPTLAPRRGHITIDGSRDGVIIHNEPVYFNSDGQNKMLYLNSKHKSKDLTSPIYLGENKILLTDVKFPGVTPSHVVRQAAAAPVAPAPEVAPTSATAPVAMPAGVQVILLPDGQLTYTLDPGVALTDDELAVVPIILEAIGKQLNSTSVPAAVPPATCGVVAVEDGRSPSAVDSAVATQTAVPDDPGACVPDDLHSPDADVAGAITEHDKQNSTPPTGVENATEANDAESLATSKENVESEATESIQLHPDGPEGASSSNTEKDSDVTPMENENPSSLEVSDKTTLENTTVAPGEATEGTVEPVGTTNQSENTSASTGSTEQSNRKTLLSDLMEMSGISEEDIRNAPIAENTTEPPGFIPAVPVLDVPATLDVPQVPDASNVAIGTPMPSLPELTPITSFSQLKYACEHNGKFFKLDLHLGTLSKIAVCIKKNKPPRMTPIVTKSVVDLTDDPDEVKQIDEVQPLDEAALPAHTIRTNKNVVTLNEEVLPSSVIRTNRSLLKPTNWQQPAQPVKPLKLFRAIRILKKKINTTNTSVQNAAASTQLKLTNLGRGLPESVTVHVKQKRKQEITQLEGSEPSICLPQASEAPVSESQEIDESSLDSSELDQYIWKDPETWGSEMDSSSDNESDDEPLASKAKRMRINEAQQEGSSGEANNGAVVPLPEEVTIRSDQQIESEAVNNKEIAGEMEVVDDTAKETEIGPEEVVDTGVAVSEDIGVMEMEQVDVAEEANVGEESVAAESEMIGEDESEEDISLVPALQVVEGMDEDGDDEDCILGF